jgi:hypothetical protein
MRRAERVGVEARNTYRGARRPPHAQPSPENRILVGEPYLLASVRPGRRVTAKLPVLVDQR